ncbi:hypothetical protein UA08_02164 [Talaromyces atroroseus]|uniref:alpha-1,2-Mannosidase n=1 Tax=Talaromyces atroroseus TaxID=1441469 RepID=A0A225B4F8_TALAT|nr:hypothetical protein UA08_02164 [Talaromyces atroroseus]OKL62166.1 hypothetical protein UA08_02164 [Talaromyces atroroseus]
MYYLRFYSLGFLLLAANPATVTAFTATGSAANVAAATDPAVAYPGPKQSGAAEGSHPSYIWPLASSSTATPNCNKVQYNFPSGTNSNTSRADAVKNLYRRSWDQYAEYCFGSDQILTLTNTCADDIFGWGATIVDGIDTAILMNLTDIVEQQLAHIAATDYTTANSLVDGFDAIIRYLGGLLSAYDILKSGYVPEGTYNQTNVDALLTQAKILGDKLKVQFDTPSGLPTSEINFTTNEPINSQYTSSLNNVTYNATNAAVAGTIVLEFARLSDLTGDESFLELALKAEGNLIFPNPAPVWPGLVGSELDIETGNYLTFDFGWHSQIDSFLEYLIKTYYYKPESAAFSVMKDFWVSTAESTIKHIALHPYNHPELTFISAGDVEGNIEWSGDDYSCFAGGNLLLGGVFLGRQDITDLGVAFTDACHLFYNTTVTGLGPLGFAWYNASNDAYEESWNTNETYREMAEEFGYFIPEGNEQWDSFPESIESIFYAYRITGDSKWQGYNWEIFESVAKQSEAGVPAAPISNVEVNYSFISELPSYYFAEVLKYLFLSFVDPEIINLDDWVFNTECHPIIRNAGSCGTD